MFVGLRRLQKQRKNYMGKIIPAILAKTKEEFLSKVDSVRDFAEEIQLDIMDGKFVPNVTWGEPDEIKKMNLPPFEVHLMVASPEEEIEKWAGAGAKRIIAHIEALEDPRSFITAVKKLGCEAGLAINPDTSIASISSFIPDLDAVLVMGVNPGFSGQEFNRIAIEKVAEIRKLDQNIPIEVDGGINLDNAAALARAGATGLVAANAIFKQSNPKVAYKNLFNKSNS